MALDRPETGEDRTESAPRSIVARLRSRPAIDHLVRAVEQYFERQGDQYAAAITYFSVLALVPLLMVAFAVAGYVLLGDPELLAELQRSLTAAVGPGLRSTVDQVVAEAIRQRDAVGAIGLLVAAYTGLAWMYRVREALSAQWGRRTGGPRWIAGMVADAGALLGLAVVLAVSLGLTMLGDTAAGAVAGPDGSSAVRAVASGVTSVGISLVANVVALLWVLARLPREHVALRRVALPAVVAAVGIEVIQRVGVIYLGWVTGSPAGIVFGPILGLLVALNLVARLLLFCTAWAATPARPAPEG